MGRQAQTGDTQVQSGVREGRIEEKSGEEHPR